MFLPNRCCRQWFFKSKSWVDHRFNSHAQELLAFTRQQQYLNKLIEIYCRHKIESATK